MKRTIPTIIAFLLSFSLFCSPTMSAPDEKPADDSLTLMGKDAGLVDKRLEQYLAGIEARNRRIDEWRSSEKGQHLAALRKQLSEARKAKDAERTDALEEELRPLTAELDALRVQTRWDVISLLSNEEQSRAVAIALHRRVSNSFSAAGINAEQDQRVQKLCQGAVAGYLEAHPLKTDPYMRALIGVQSKLSKQVREEILTPQQADAWKAAQKRDGGSAARDDR